MTIVSDSSPFQRTFLSIIQNAWKFGRGRFQRRHFLLQTVSQFTFRLISDFSAASLHGGPRPLFVRGDNLVLFCIRLRMKPTALDANNHKLFFG